MNRTIITALAMAGAFALVPAAATAGTVYNSAPTDGWYFGTDNDYSPANTAVLTTDGGNELYLRGHETYQGAPVPHDNGIYDIALGTANVSFDFGFDNNNTVDDLSGFDGVTASITLKNLGTGATAIFDPLTWPSDNEFQGGSVQNSARLAWFNVAGLDFDANTDATYKVTLNVWGLDGAGSHSSLAIYEKIGAGSGAVPEPASWAMMLGGFGLVGGAMRRRKAKVAFA